MMFQLVICTFSLSRAALAQYTPSPRWAQAVALLESTLYVHGGLSDPFNSYSYTSAPETSDLIILDLSTSFDSSSPPWQLFLTNSSPALAWHTLSAFDHAELLLFGGQPDPDSSTVLTTLNDSSGLLSTSDKSAPSFSMQSRNWANEPMRRIHHSSSFTSGKVWIIGGEKADGSGNAFSEHYAFSPSGPGFTQLPYSSSAPPDIFGHASLVLPDGRLLVLGGYCASCSELVPMNTIWSLNTTTDPPVWENLYTLNTSLPSSRRNFAAVVLATGQVLIHGGGDAQLQTTYSDGWILDTGQNPMVWSSVAALTQLGQRKDHFAVQAGGYVLFCFGYGSSSPASASLFVYDPSISSMVTSYIPPSPGSTPAITSLPVPTQTGSDPSSNGGASGGTPGASPYTSSSSTVSPSSHVAAIALGTTFGVLGLVAAGVATIYYARRRHNRDRRAAGRFSPLENTPEFSEEGSFGGSTPEAAHLDDQITDRGDVADKPGVIADILAHLGISKSTSGPPQPRKDMFADEDARSFGWVGYSSTVHRQGSGGTSVWSLRSVGALVRGMIGREASRSGGDQGAHEWEKPDHLREGVQEGLIRQGSPHSATSSHPAHRGDGSFFSYTNPFGDLPDHDYDDLSLPPDIPEKDADYDNYLPRNNETDISEPPTLSPQDSVRPFSERSRVLASFEESSRTSLTNPFNSPPSPREPSHEEILFGHMDNASRIPLASASSASYSPGLPRFIDPHPVTLVPQCSTISGSTLSRSLSTSRHDGWWTRVTKSPFLDRRASTSSTKPLNFRDPRPAPLLGFEEPKKSSAVPAHSDDTLVDMPVRHDRSLSSAHSGHTANTASAEHLGGSYDVVQRLASDGSSSRRAPSLGSAEITEQGIVADTVDKLVPAEGALTSGRAAVDPPRSTLSRAIPTLSVDSETPTEPLSLKSNPPSPKRGGVVTDKVRAYEHTLAQESELQKTALPRNTRHREEVPSRTRPTIQYGVAPRASLYIANPDLGRLS